ncbi:BAG molecular chaperone regulator 1 [Phlyctochytrium bullatum]|nr:BAG molecular chaperone regulator 1 [Phlyctochytrium bullatum]
MERCSIHTGVPTDRMKLLMSGGEPTSPTPPHRRSTGTASGPHPSNGGGGYRFSQDSRSTSSHHPYPGARGAGGAYAGNRTPPGGYNENAGGAPPSSVESVVSFFKNVGRQFDSAMDQFVNWMSGEEDELSGERGSFVMMKDMNATLATYGLKSGSKIMMIGEKPLTPEEASLKKLEEIMSHVHGTIVPLIEEYSSKATLFIGAAATGGVDGGDDVPTEKQVKFEHSRVGELLLQALLKIDGVNVPEGNDVVRLKRKECVREVNALLDRADGIKERVAEAVKRKAAAL